MTAVPHPLGRLLAMTGAYEQHWADAHAVHTPLHITHNQQLRDAAGDGYRAAVWLAVCEPEYFAQLKHCVEVLLEIASSDARAETEAILREFVAANAVSATPTDNAS